MQRIALSIAALLTLATPSLVKAQSFSDLEFDGYHCTAAQYTILVNLDTGKEITVGKGICGLSTEAFFNLGYFFRIMYLDNKYSDNKDVVLVLDDDVEKYFSGVPI